MPTGGKGGKRMVAVILMRACDINYLNGRIIQHIGEGYMRGRIKARGEFRPRLRARIGGTCKPYPRVGKNGRQRQHEGAAKADNTEAERRCRMFRRLRYQS